MSDIKALIIFLSQFDLSSLKIKKIIDFLGEKASIKAFKKAKLVENDLLKADVYQKMLAMADESMVRTYSLNLADRGIHILCKFDDDYPQKLFDLPDAPYILYYKGNIGLLNKPSLAVVGTRKPTNYGRIVTQRLVRDLSNAGVVIISGLAYGVDSVAHRECLEAGGQTIAVLGGGFDHIYPAEHEGLANQIAEKGLLLSEYRPKMIATKYSFPTRNRIVAGLCDGLLVTEASIKSGTIHTKDFALDYGRNMYAVPGNIDSQSSALTNQIIKCGQAGLVTDANDILKDYQVSKSNKQQTMFDFSNLNDEEKEIVKILSSGMKTIDEIAKNSKLSINILNTYLTTLEISAIIKRMPGGYFALV